MQGGIDPRAARPPGTPTWFAPVKKRVSRYARAMRSARWRLSTGAAKKWSQAFAIGCSVLREAGPRQPSPGTAAEIPRRTKSGGIPHKGQACPRRRGSMWSPPAHEIGLRSSSTDDVRATSISPSTGIAHLQVLRDIQGPHRRPFHRVRATCRSCTRARRCTWPGGSASRPDAPGQPRCPRAGANHVARPRFLTSKRVGSNSVSERTQVMLNGGANDLGRHA